MSVKRRLLICQLKLDLLELVVIKTLSTVSLLQIQDLQEMAVMSNKLDSMIQQNLKKLPTLMSN